MILRQIAIITFQILEDLNRTLSLSPSDLIESDDQKNKLKRMNSLMTVNEIFLVVVVDSLASSEPAWVAQLTVD